MPRNLLFFDTETRMVLQWGRVRLNAEMTVSAKVHPAFLGVLQWGRVRLNAEM